MKLPAARGNEWDKCVERVLRLGSYKMDTRPVV